jgi:hypothetical protein
VASLVRLLFVGLLDLVTAGFVLAMGFSYARRGMSARHLFE